MREMTVKIKDLKCTRGGNDWCATILMLVRKKKMGCQGQKLK
jgi:hypothetical protein